MDVSPQPLAVVLLHKDLLQLSGDNLDYRCSVLLAMGSPCRPGGGQESASTFTEAGEGGEVSSH